MEFNKTLHLALFIIPGLIFSQGCKKSLFSRHAEGVVTDITDGSPIPFAQIAIQNEQVEFLSKSKKEVLATGQTDIKGEFELKYNTPSKGSNYVFGQAEHYFFIAETDFDEVTLTSRKKLEVRLTPKTQVIVKFNIKDSSIEYVYFRFLPETHSNEEYNAHFGVSEKEFDVSGNTENNYGYVISYKNTTTVTKSGKIYCPKWDKPSVVLNIDL
jgi:hypothetical protein